MTPTFDDEVVCPYCGSEVLLAHCPIVATNPLLMDQLRNTLRPVAAVPAPLPPAPAGPADDQLVAGFDTAIGGVGPDPVPAPAPVAAPTPVVAVAVPPVGSADFTIGKDLTSGLDGEKRVVLALPPPRPPDPEKKPRWGAHPPPLLPSAAELAEHTGGRRARPARVCPRPLCHHPLPAALDERSPIVVAVVGNTGASKTSLIAALVDTATGVDGMRALDLDEFVLAEATARLLKPVLDRYRKRERTKITEAEAIGAPLEFHVTLGAAPDAPLVVIVNDIPGETYMDPDKRATFASHLQWADLVLFVFNPEEVRSIGTLTSNTDQATLLNGVYEDVRKVKDPSPAAIVDAFPPLVFVVAKADVLARERVLDPDRLGADDLWAALHAVGADDVLAAVERWPSVSCTAAAALPEEGSAFGIGATFDAAFRAVAGLRWRR